MTHENKFGMFVHWGIYALTGVQEQALIKTDISHEAYEALASRFNPVKYDPEEWVLLAKSAGMKYICFTTKHHDGFCMWNTKQTDYNIMNTPYGKDVLKMLADACEKHGLGLSFYYSCPDWHHEYGYNPAASHQWGAKYPEKVDTGRYIEYVKAQVKELLTGYGRLYAFYWDIPPKIYDPSINEMIRELQPGIYINDRGYDKGDFSTPEREFEAVATARFTRMTEACNSVGEQSWGFRTDEDFYSMRHLISAIDRYMAMGASYVLNVGPTPEGQIPEEHAKRIRRIGDWYNRMGGALECHEADPFDYQIVGNYCIPTVKDGKTYLHFPDGLRSDSVALRKFPNLPKSVKLLNTGTHPEFKVSMLPAYCEDGKPLEHLHVRGIPVDDLSSEAIVLEIEW